MTATQSDERRRSGRPGRLSLFIVVGLAAVGALVDQVLKSIAVDALSGTAHVSLLGDLVSLQLVYNPGAAFSLGAGSAWIFTALGTVVAVAVIVASPRLPSKAFAVVGGVFLGGLLGNLVDRLFREPGFGRGHVVDYLAFPWFVCNFADVLITASVISAGALMLRQERREAVHAE